MTDDAFTNWLSTYHADIERQKLALPQHKDALLGALRAAGVAHVIVSYDGEGDSGQADSAHAVALDGSAIDLATLTAPDPQAASTEGAEKASVQLSQLVENFLWAVLDAHHGGFENNDGGFGELSIDVTERSVTLEHSDRIIQVDSSMVEL